MAHVLHQGVINRRLSKFGGKPSPMYVLEAALPTGTAAEAVETAAAASSSGGEAALDGGASGSPAGAGSAAAPAAGGSDPRLLRVLFAANENATVVLTVIELQQGDGG